MPGNEWILHKLGRRWIFLRDEIEAAVRGKSGDGSTA
jgi:hypothetical protein